MDLSRFTTVKDGARTYKINTEQICYVNFQEAGDTAPRRRFSSQVGKK